jgi:hypothetical protein
MNNAIRAAVIVFLSLTSLLVLNVSAQTIDRQSTGEPIKFQVLTMGFIACPEEQDIVELAEAEKDAQAFFALHLKKIYDGKCTGKMKSFEVKLVANVKYKETPSRKGRYACFNSNTLGELSKKKDCGLTSYIKTKDELIAARNGSHLVVENSADSAIAECVEGGTVRAFRKEKTWMSTGVFEDNFNERKGSTIDAIRRRGAKEALTDACRGMSR